MNSHRLTENSSALTDFEQIVCLARRLDETALTRFLAGRVSLHVIQNEYDPVMYLAEQGEWPAVDLLMHLGAKPQSFMMGAGMGNAWLQVMHNTEYQDLLPFAVYGFAIKGHQGAVFDIIEFLTDPELKSRSIDYAIEGFAKGGLLSQAKLLINEFTHDEPFENEDYLYGVASSSNPACESEYDKILEVTLKSLGKSNRLKQLFIKGLAEKEGIEKKDIIKKIFQLDEMYPQHQRLLAKKLGARGNLDDITAFLEKYPDTAYAILEGLGKAGQYSLKEKLLSKRELNFTSLGTADPHIAFIKGCMSGGHTILFEKLLPEALQIARMDYPSSEFTEDLEIDTLSNAMHLLVHITNNTVRLHITKKAKENLGEKFVKEMSEIQAIMKQSHLSFKSAKVKRTRLQTLQKDSFTPAEAEIYLKYVSQLELLMRGSFNNFPIEISFLIASYVAGADITSSFENKIHFEWHKSCVITQLQKLSLFNQDVFPTLTDCKAAHTSSTLNASLNKLKISMPTFYQEKVASSHRHVEELDVKQNNSPNY